MSATFATLQQHLHTAGIELDSAQSDALPRYVDLLLEWNRSINLISRKDEEQVWLHHILHSLAPLFMRRLPVVATYIDLGSGGGLPGIPLAIMLPESSFVLVDSIGKKMRAVEAIVTALGMGNVRCVAGRIEEQTRLRQSVDVVLARGVTRMLALSRWSWPLFRRDGQRLLMAWKGGDIAAELAEARQHAGVQHTEVLDIVLEGEPWFNNEEKKLIEVRFT
ncbi:MAG: 16S rRNA (guanine(527)-N(7))-methyltransferase RsmG [Bacteroidia bacterium]|nr:16S rRNA (guanine(527)-N(7))-methyltransferase RsmG [Bacteroidia bacterium]